MDSPNFSAPEIGLPVLLNLRRHQSHLYLKILELISRRLANALVSDLEVREEALIKRLVFLDQVSWVADFRRRELRQETRTCDGVWAETGLTFELENEFKNAYWIGLIIYPVLDEFGLNEDRSIEVTLSEWLIANLVERFQKDIWLEPIRRQVFTFCKTVPGLYDVIRESQLVTSPEPIDSKKYSAYWAKAEFWTELLHTSPQLIHVYHMFVEHFELPVGSDLKVIKEGCLKYGWKPGTWRFLVKHGRGCYEPFFQEHLEPELETYNFFGFVEMQHRANLERPLHSDLAQVFASVVQTIDIDDLPFDPRIMKVGLSRWKEKDKTGEGKVFANTEWLELLIWMRDTQPTFDKNQWRTGWHAIWRQYQTWLQTNRETCRWTSALKEFDIGSCIVKSITDDVSLANEGLVMKNCVGSYGDVCKSGGYRVFAIISKRSQRHIATVGLENEGEWKLDQVKGKCNSDVNAETQRMAQLILRRYIDSEKRLTEKHISINYFEVQVDKSMGRASMLWAKDPEGKWVNVAYEDYPIPSTLIKKFDTYSHWFEMCANDAATRYKEHLKMRDFKRSLAFELREFLEPEYTVYLWSAVANRRIALRKERSVRLAA